MRVYYMTSIDVALRHILLEQRMKVSRFEDLNDPFELACHDVGHRNARVLSKAYIDVAKEKFGLICFSDNWKSPVMWAHYASKHEGVCLGFDVHEDYLGYVQYIDSRLLGTVEFFDRDGINFIDQMLYHKAREWSYERELRAIVLLDGPETPIRHIAFGMDMQLREVLIGARCNLSPSELAPFILPQETSVLIKKVRPAFKTFEMVENKRYKPINIPAGRDCRGLHGVLGTGPRFILRTPFTQHCVKSQI
jgi:hypothetical protein